jgi:hypothetical protein
VKSIVVYQSIWGNTAAVARAIAEGIGGGTKAVSTAEAKGVLLQGVDLLVVGSPLLGFRVPNEMMIQGIRNQPQKVPPDLSQPPMRTWLDALPGGTGRSAGFETRIWWSPGSAAGGILKALAAAGYEPLAKPQKFVVQGAQGPLKPGELEKAKLWGAELARAMK